MALTPAGQVYRPTPSRKAQNCKRQLGEVILRDPGALSELLSILSALGIELSPSYQPLDLSL